MRHQTTERSLFGERNVAVWATEPKIVNFEKGDVKIRVKIVEFDYGATQDHVLIEIATNGLDCPGIQRGVNIFEHNEITRVLLKHLKMDKRDMQRTLTPHRSPDAIMYELTKSLQIFNF